ncbi:MAG TPA: hypothetical protein VFZ32_08315 [Micromonosporaceae bacterium]
MAAIASRSEPQRLVDSAQPDLAKRHSGMDRTEENYYRAMHYLAGALWFLGAGDEALAALHELVGKANAKGKHGE